MKRIIRNMSVAILFSPLIVAIYLTSILFGKNKAENLWGSILAFSAKQSLRVLVPRIKDADEFDKFPSKMKSNFWLWRPLLDIEVVEETKDIFKINVKNCPFCEVFNSTGLSDLSPYFCKGDWDKANENKDKWIFERKHQIGTGDSFCDHTYMRKK